RRHHPVLLQRGRLLPLRGRRARAGRGGSDRARHHADRELRPAAAVLRSLRRRDPALAVQAHGGLWRRRRERAPARRRRGRRALPPAGGGRRPGAALLHPQPGAAHGRGAGAPGLTGALLPARRPRYPRPMHSRRRPLTRALPWAVVLALAAAQPSPPAAAQVRRCTLADGGTVYTDRSCESLDAVESRPEAHAPAVGALARYRGGCARSLQDLVFEVTAAIDARDT